jgi:hypothetical protein
MWNYKGKQLEDDDIPVGSIGFIYIIRQISTGRKYIGRKLLTSATTKTINGKKKKTRKPSDWKDYWSSSPMLKAYIAEHGTDDFTREILVFVSSKSELMYAEEFVLYQVDALLSDQWMNENIRAKVMKKWFVNKPYFISQINELRTMF